VTSRRQVGAWLAAFVLLALFCAPRAHAAACVAGACIETGPRLASFDTQQSALLNPLTSALLGTSATVDIADWQRLAGANVKVADVLNLLQVQTSAVDTTALLTTPINVSTVLNAVATVAGSGSTAAIGINNAVPQLNLGTKQVQLGDLIKLATNAGDTQINVLDLVMGTIEAHNFRYGVNTPTPITVGTPSVFGLTGIDLVKISARVVEPPEFYCGGVGASHQFYTAAIRLKLDITIPQPLGQVGLVTDSLITTSTTTLLPNTSLYVDVARADGWISQLDAAAGTMRVKITPGITSLYLGQTTDTTFFSSAAISAANFTPVTVANVDIKLLNIIGLASGQVLMKASATSSAPLQEELMFTGPYPQTLATSSSANAVGVLAANLIGNIALTTNINLLGLIPVTVVTTQLLAPVKTAISAVTTPVLTAVVDPLLSLLGIKIGQAVVTAYGPYRLCTVAGNCYNDANHSLVKDPGEAGTGQTLWAKLVATASPTTVYASTSVNSSTGAFSFSNVQSQGASTNYSVIIDTNNTASDVTATAPTGWVPTEVPTLSRSIALATADISGLTYGLYNGSSLTGRVFVDTGVGGGTANNVVKDGTEPGLPGARVTITDNAGTTIYDSALAADTGNYTLWIPAAAGATTLKITEANPNPYLSTGANVGTTGGTYTRATDTVAFTHAIGSAYSGVNFADVPTSALQTDGRQVIVPGNVAFYPHKFIAGTAGSVTFTPSAPVMNGWSNLLYRDTDCNGAIDTGEVLVSGAISTTAAQQLCLVVRVFASDVAAYNDEYPVTLAAAYAWSGSALSETLSRNDLTMIGSANGSGLVLTKAVDKATAASGATLTYTITYKNNGTGPLSQIKIYDNTPAYTVHTSAACGTLGSGLTGCAVTTQPAVSASGPLLWTFTGSLASGATGTVTFTVTVQ